MAIIRLQVSPAAVPSTTFIDEVGGQHVLARLRLRTQVVGESPSSIGSSPPMTNMFTAIIDTGAPISIIPFSIWNSFKPTLVHFPTPRLCVRGIVGGDKYDAWIGSIWMSLSDLEGRRMPAIRVIAHFQQQPCKYPGCILLGLGHGILEFRRIFREPVMDSVEQETTAYSPNYYQRWWLMDS